MSLVYSKHAIKTRFPLSSQAFRRVRAAGWLGDAWTAGSPAVSTLKRRGARPAIANCATHGWSTQAARCRPSWL